MRNLARRRYIDAAPISRSEGGSRERSRLWKVGVIFAVALGFVMAMLDVTVVRRFDGRSALVAKYPSD